MLLHHRDGNTKVNPNTWAFFGGLNESDETPAQCFVRELKEEIGLAVDEKEIVPLRDYLNERLDTHRYVFFARSDVEAETLTLGEGAGFAWIPFAELKDFPLTARTIDDLAFFKKEFTAEKLRS